MNIVKKISITNFRCHDNFELNITNPTTLITGPNGSGKTSIIEALYISLRGKSFKSTDQYIIKNQANSYHIQVDFHDTTIRKTSYQRLTSKKEFLIGDKKSTRLPVKYRYPIIFFEPNHLNLIYSSPSRRRAFLDDLISQINPSYHQAVNRYEKALKQRNALLKSDHITKEKLFPWDIIIAKYGSEIINTRKLYVDKINQSITGIYKSIANQPDQLQVTYTTNPLNETEFLKILEKNLPIDQVTKSTSFGPHRDDMIFYFNHHLAVDTASRGELRSSILALKFIETQLVEKHLNQSPIILLDDIFSELDEPRQRHLTNNFQSHQIIITSTKPPKNIRPTIQL